MAPALEENGLSHLDGGIPVRAKLDFGLSECFLRNQRGVELHGALPEEILVQHTRGREKQIDEVDKAIWEDGEIA